MIKRILKSDLFIVTVVYSVAHGLMVLNNGVFWDDWAVFNQTPETLLGYIRQRDGLFLRYLIHFPLLSDFGVAIIRIIIFLSYLIATLLFYNILTYIKEIDGFSKLIIVLIFALFPINQARIAISSGLYALCYVLFYLGFWLLAIYISTKKYYLRVLSLLIFFISFNTVSLLVFYLIPLLFIFYIEKETVFSFRSFFII